MTEVFSAWSERLRKSDSSACTEVFRQLHAPLIRYAARLTRDENAAYDVVQESFIKLWEHRQNLDPQRPLKAYLYSIVRNTALNHITRRTNIFSGLDSVQSNSEDPSASPEDPLISSELKSSIHTWINELPPRRQEAFRLSRFENLSHEEIADVMGLEKRTVTHHIMLALRHLRDRLATYQAA